MIQKGIFLIALQTIINKLKTYHHSEKQSLHLNLLFPSLRILQFSYIHFLCL